MVFDVILPVLLLALAALLAAVVSYGVHPLWAQYPHGVQFILMARRFQWPLAALMVVACVALLALVISGKRRAWWLIGLMPVLAILGQRFLPGHGRFFFVNRDPVFVSAEQANFVSDDDWVVGLIDGDDAVAYPFASLYPAPLVIRPSEERPTLLMWSAFANRALAVQVDRSLKSEDLEIVSMPANALLVYNTRLGQFINGVTGLQPNGLKPAGFLSAVATQKTTWKRWRARHPGTLVLAPPPDSGPAPSQPILPLYPMPPMADAPPAGTMVDLLDVSPPVAVTESESGERCVNVSDPPVLLFRDPTTGVLLAFDRQLPDELTPRFSMRVWLRWPGAILIDSDSRSAWTADGRAVGGPLKGQRLRPLAVDDGVNADVLHFWCPRLKLVSP